MDQGAKATHDPYPPIHTLIHTLDPYPRSIPLSRWRKTDAGLNDAFYPNIYCFWSSYWATPIATTVASTAASTASAAAAAAATTSDYPPRSCCYCSCWSCSRCWCWLMFSVCFGCWTNVTSWLATRNIASAPWRLVRPVLLPLGAYCTSSEVLWLQVLLFLLCLARVELKKHGVLIHTPIQTRSMPGPYPNPVTPQQVPIWTLLSEPTRKLAVWPVFQPPKLTHGAIATPKQQGPEGRTGHAGHGRHDLSSSRQGSHRARSPHRNRRALRDGRGLRATAPTCLTSAFWTYKKSSCLT